MLLAFKQFEIMFRPLADILEFVNLYKFNEAYFQQRQVLRGVVYPVTSQIYAVAS